MLAIDALLRQSGDIQPDTVLHVGAGRGGILKQYANLSLPKVVLVEGDPSNASSLRRAARPFAWAHVLARAVAVQDERIPWNRYNLCALCGPLRLDELTITYPRLHKDCTLSIEATSLTSLLRETVDVNEGGRSAVLVLDVPGQEGPLLESLGEELSRLSSIIVRRCALPMSGLSTWSRVQGCMHEFGFELIGHEVEDEPLWPVAVFRRNSQKCESRQLRADIDLLRHQLSRVSAELADATASAENASLLDRQALGEKASALHAMEEVAAQRALAVQQLLDAQEEHRALIATLTEGKVAAERRAAASEASVIELTRTNEQHVREIDLLEQAVHALEASSRESVELKMRLDSLRDEYESKHSSSLRLVESAQTKLAAAERRGSDLSGALDAARKRADGLETELRGAQASLNVLVRTSGVSETALRDLQDRYASLLLEHTEDRSIVEQLAERLETARRLMRSLQDVDVATSRDTPARSDASEVARYRAGARDERGSCDETTHERIASSVPGGGTTS